MPADDHSRFLVLHDLAFRTKRGKGAPLRLIREVGDENDVEQVLEQAFRGGKAEVKIKDDDVIELSRLSFRRDQGVAILLLQRGDPEGITPMFKHRKTKEVRPSDRTEDDLIAHSCHIIIKLEPEKINPPTYRVAIEETVGISKTYISSFFRHVLAAAPYTSNDRRGEEVEAVCTSDLNGHPSESVEEAMHQGVIRQVQLIKPGELEEFDSEHVEVNSIIQQLKIKGKGKAAMDALIDIWNKNRANWSEMRVQVQSLEKKSRIIHIDREEDAAQALFVKSEFVPLAKKIDVCCAEIHEDLVLKARAILGT